MTEIDQGDQQPPLAQTDAERERSMDAAIRAAHTQQGVRLVTEKEPMPAPTGLDELFEDMGEILRTVFVPGRARPFLVGPIPPVLLDWINKVQDDGPVVGYDANRNPIHGAPDRIGYEAKIFAAGLRDPATKQRVCKSHDEILALASKVGDRLYPGWVKTVTTEILLACRFGPARSFDDLKNGSGSTPNGSTSSTSPSNTSVTGQSESVPGSEPAGS